MKGMAKSRGILGGRGIEPPKDWDFAMTIRSRIQLDFPVCQERRVGMRFDGGSVASDAGVSLLRQAGRRLGPMAPARD